MSEDVRLLCIKPVRPVADGGFVNRDFDWNVVPEGSMCGPWLSPESLKELRLTFKASESLLEKPGTMVSCTVHGSLSREGAKVAFLKAGAIGETRWQVCVAQCLCPEG